MSSDSIMPTETDCRSAIVRRLSKWPLINSAIPNALTYLHERGDLARVVNAALPQVRQLQGLDPNRIDNILLKVFSAQNLRMLASGDSPEFKLIRERQLFEAMSDKVIQRAIRVAVDGPQGTWPGEILVKVTKQLVKDSTEPGAEELTPFKIDRTLEDIVVNDNWGAFWWDASRKRHLALNSEEWRDRNSKKTQRPLEIGLGDLTGVYGENVSSSR